MNGIQRRVTASLAVAMATAVLAVSAQAAGKKSNGELKAKWDGRSKYLCCNLHHHGDEISDANYMQGSRIPWGTRVSVHKVRKGAIVLNTPNGILEIEFGFNEHRGPIDDFAETLLLDDDPKAIPRDADVEAAINDGRVEVGMSREEVMASQGIPPGHATRSLNDRTWKYWVSRGATFTVTFGGDGLLESINGNAANTSNRPVGRNKTTIKRELE